MELWDREIPLTANRHPVRLMRSGMPGVYVWYLNQHFIDSVLYVGQSGNVLERIHEEYRAPNGFISRWIEEKINEPPIYCDRYSDPITDGPLLGNGKCDCLPRLKVKITICEFGLDELEKHLIQKLNPPLNKMLYGAERLTLVL